MSKIGENNDLVILGKNNMPEDMELDDIQTIIEQYEDCGAFYIALLAYNYGKIQGKRSERNKKMRNRKIA